MMRYVKNYPVTSLLFIINVIMALFVALNGGFTTANLYKFGAFNAPSVRSGDYYRLITSMFLHGGITHVTLNMIVLIQSANGIEKQMGKMKFLLFYLMTGIAGNVLSLYFSDPRSISIGASGALFGIMGCYLFIAFFRQNVLVRGARQQIVIMIVINLALTFAIPFIDKSAHVGGLLSGFLLSGLLLHNKQARNSQLLEKDKNVYFDDC